MAQSWSVVCKVGLPVRRRAAFFVWPCFPSGCPFDCVETVLCLGLPFIFPPRGIVAMSVGSPSRGRTDTMCHSRRKRREHGKGPPVGSSCLQRCWPADGDSTQVLLAMQHTRGPPHAGTRSKASKRTHKPQHACCTWRGRGWRRQNGRDKTKADNNRESKESGQRRTTVEKWKAPATRRRLRFTHRRTP